MRPHPHPHRARARARTRLRSARQGKQSSTTTRTRTIRSGGIFPARARGRRRPRSAGKKAIEHDDEDENDEQAADFSCSCSWSSGRRRPRMRKAIEHSDATIEDELMNVPTSEKQSRKRDRHGHRGPDPSTHRTSNGMIKAKANWPIDSLTCPQNGLMGHRTGHRRRCWGQVRFEYSGQMTSLTFCNMSTAAWEVRVAPGSFGSFRSFDQCRTNRQMSPDNSERFDHVPTELTRPKERANADPWKRV